LKMVLQKLSLNIINNAGNHLLALINDILDISKIESGQLSVETTSFNLKHMLQDMEQMFRARTEIKGLSLNFIGADDLPEAITSDEPKVRQILINLLGNAVKFTESGSVLCQT
jgi:signal transduction histidine kinase